MAVRTSWLKYVALMLVLMCSLTAHAQIDALYVFGDSLSDNGNLYKLKDAKTPLSPPYYDGRFSNGPVWVEDLVPLIGLKPNALHDFAYGGAQTSTGFVPNYKKQIKNYLRTQTALDPDGLYVIWIGANNYFFHPYAALSQVPKNVSDIIWGIRALAARGAQNFLVINLPDLSKNPWGQRKNATDPDYATHLHDLIVAHNQDLAQDLNTLGLEQPSLHIVQIDAAHLFDAAIEHPKQFGVNNVTTPCYQGSFRGKAVKGDAPVICADPDDYLFWDMIHPTRKIHHDFAVIAKEDLEDTGMVG